MRKAALLTLTLVIVVFLAVLAMKWRQDRVREQALVIQKEYADSRAHVHAELQKSLHADDWQEFLTIRAQVLREDPGLAAENEELTKEMHRQEEDLDAAMIKADPAVAPILAKMHAKPQQNPSSNR